LLKIKVFILPVCAFSVPLLCYKLGVKKTTAPTMNHFYEKLLLLKDKMNTNSGKKIAAQRHPFMEMYLPQFYDEWNGIR
jgi:uncharacterized protein